MTRQRRRAAERRKAKSSKTTAVGAARRVERETAWHREAEKKAKRLMYDQLHPQADAEETNFRHSGWTERRRKIRAGMVAAGYNASRLDRFDNCGADAWVECDTTDGTLHLRASYCKDRWCLPCGRARSLLIGDNLAKKIEHDRHLHIVLTTKHKAEPLAAQVSALFANFKRLRGTRLWKNAVDGGATFVQCHVSRNDGLWHVHCHSIGRGRWLDQQKLSAAWLEITGDSSDCHVSGIDDVGAAVREVTRYAAKPVDGDTTDDPDRLAELMRSLAGRHLCFTWGRWRGFKLTQPPVIESKGPRIRLGRLVDFIARAAAGEIHATQVLEVLRRRSSPANGPPLDERNEIVTRRRQLALFPKDRNTLTPTPTTSTADIPRPLQPTHPFSR